MKKIDLEDYSRRIERLMKAHAAAPDFPKLADYGLTQAQLDDYLFDKQAALDSRGSDSFRLTVLGICVFAPVLAFQALPRHALPWGENSFYVAIAIGIFIAIAYAIISKLIVKNKLSKLRDERAERFLQAVESYNHKE